MKIKFQKLLFFTVSLLTIVSCAKIDDIKSNDEVLNQKIENKYIITLKAEALNLSTISLRSDLNYNQKAELVKAEIGTVVNTEGVEISNTYFNSITGFSAVLTQEAYDRLKNNPNVESIEEDVIVSLGKPSGKGGGGSGSTVQTTPWGITRVGGAQNGAGKKAWIIDSGIDLDHEDLNVDVANSKSFLSGGGGSSSPDDQNGHGTHVAGTIAAIDNNKGVVGVAAGASVVAVRVLDRRGSGSLSGVIAGVDYVAANASNGDVANLSLGGGVSTSLDNAIYNLAQTGVKVAVAAGNESDDANNHSPARVNHPNVYTVSAMDANDRFAYFSNYGSAVDYCAPGVSIKSTWKGNGYNTIDGTSMATPHVAGILLIGNVTTNGYVLNDPDGNADPIAHL